MLWEHNLYMVRTVTEAFERGAAMIWEHNLYMARIAAELGLLVKQIDGSGGLAIFDGQNIVFSTELGLPVKHIDGYSGLAIFDGQNSVFSTELGLPVKQIDGPGGLAILDGKNIVFSTSSSWLSKVKTIWRYGLSPLVYGRHALKVWKEHFFPIYKLQEDGVGFQSPEEMLQQLGLYNLTQETCIDHAKIAMEKTQQEF
eukprot:gene18403-24878_t